MKILGWIIATPFILLALYALLRFAFCRPNYFVVKTATPMVEKIAEHIVEHGIPESLEQIPNLPYELKGCKRKIEYRKRVDLKNIKVEKQEEADGSVIEETCSFLYEKNLYKTWFWFSESYKYSQRANGVIKVQLGKSSVITRFNYKNEKLVSSAIGSSFDNRFGFCRQFKQ